jgi:hypothetical protein
MLITRYRDECGRHVFDASTRISPQGYRCRSAASSGISALKLQARSGSRVTRCIHELAKEANCM